VADDTSHRGERVPFTGDPKRNTACHRLQEVLFATLQYSAFLQFQQHRNRCNYANGAFRADLSVRADFSVFRPLKEKSPIVVEVQHSDSSRSHLREPAAERSTKKSPITTQNHFAH